MDTAPVELTPRSRSSRSAKAKIWSPKPKRAPLAPVKRPKRPPAPATPPPDLHQARTLWRPQFSLVDLDQDSAVQPPDWRYAAAMAFLDRGAELKPPFADAMVQR